ncbi:rCG50129 [Rattus norvegicus]|uniref:RCG50129 n=1 Tax=Rattus norvegicus TaxID=10116 RepID=A6JVG5_RAT|nr:rCG50129 [Rattus norvegicus]
MVMFEQGFRRCETLLKEVCHWERALRFKAIPSIISVCFLLLA